MRSTVRLWSQGAAASFPLRRAGTGTGARHPVCAALSLRHTYFSSRLQPSGDRELIWEERQA